MHDTRLMIGCPGSIFNIGLEEVGTWRAILDCAEEIALIRNGTPLIGVKLGGRRRWIAFQRQVAGSPLAAIGYQETVGALSTDNMILSGSNRKVIAWLHPSGEVRIE